MLCIVSSIHFGWKQKTFWAALFLALGISIKLVPLVFLLFFVFRGQYKLIITTSVLVLFFSFTPFLLFGSEIIPLYKQFLVSTKIMTHIQGNSEIYFTLNSFLNRIFPATISWSWLKYANAGLFLSGIFFFEYRYSKKEGYQIEVLSLYLLSILFISPMSETHHLVYLSIPFLQILLFLIDRNQWQSRHLSFWALNGVICFVLSHFFRFGPFLFLSLIAVSVFMLIKLNRGLSFHYHS